MGAGDREFESLYPDTRETTVLCQEAPSNGGASYLSYIINQSQINPIKGHVFEGHTPSKECIGIYISIPLKFSQRGFLFVGLWVDLKMGILIKNLSTIEIQNRDDGWIYITGSDNPIFDELHYLQIFFLSLSKCLFDIGNQSRLVGLILRNSTESISKAIEQKFEFNLLNNTYDKLVSFYDFDVKEHLKIEKFFVCESFNPEMKIGESKYTIKHNRFIQQYWIMHSKHTYALNNILIPINILALLEQLITETLMHDKIILKLAEDLGNKMIELDRESNILQLSNIPKTQRFINSYIAGIRANI